MVELSRTRIGFLASECTPFVKTGGLADVVGALPRALEHLGADVRVFLPLHRTIHTGKNVLTRARVPDVLSVMYGGKNHEFCLWESVLPDSQVPVYFIDHPGYFDREAIYTQDVDEAERYIFFQQASLQAMRVLRWSPDVVHCNDWQSALIPVFLRELYSTDPLFRRSLSVLSIHNIGYQGLFNYRKIGVSGLLYDIAGLGEPLEFHGKFSFLKAGIEYADRITTVSPTYAEEIQTQEQGHGLDGVLRQRADRIAGILNGIDTTVWDPKIDPLIPVNYSSRSLSRKSKNRQALIDYFGLETGIDTPVLGIISRFAHQKGLELLIPFLEDDIRTDRYHLTVLGSGDTHTEDYFRRLASGHPHRVGVEIGYNESLAHLIEAGADLFVMPSLYEPCGLNQMYSLNYGTIPVVRRTGGLADTVVDVEHSQSLGNGFVFEEATSAALRLAIHRAVQAYPDRDDWRNTQEHGMNLDFSWDHAAGLYMSLYKEAMTASRISDRTGENG